MLRERFLWVQDLCSSPQRTQTQHRRHHHASSDRPTWSCCRVEVSGHKLAGEPTKPTKTIAAWFCVVLFAFSDVNLPIVETGLPPSTHKCLHLCQIVHPETGLAAGVKTFSCTAHVASRESSTFFVLNGKSTNEIRRVIPSGAACATGQSF